MVAGGRDGVIAQAVAFLAGVRREGSLDDALATAVAHGARQDADDVLEAGLGDLDRADHFLDLVGVFLEADFGEALLEGFVFVARVVAKWQGRLNANLVDHIFDLGVHAAHDA